MSGPLLCYLGLGSNLGHRARTLARAVAALASLPQIRLLRVSPVYETASVGYADGPDYLNLVLSLRAACEPLTLLHLTQAIESALGRQRPFPNAPRTIDIDLLACGGIISATPELCLPHPRMWERQFVLAPLAAIAPAFALAGQGPVSKLLDPHDPQIRLAGRLLDLVRSDA